MTESVEGDPDAPPPPEEPPAAPAKAAKPRRRPRRRRAKRKRPTTAWQRRLRRIEKRARQVLAFGRRTFTAIERSHYRRFLISFIAGLVVLGAMRVPAINRSMFGEPDRLMMETAFKMRADLVTGGDPALLIDIDDQTISDIRQTGGAVRAPSATAPRGVLADTLEYIRTAPPGVGAQAVIVDIDLATPTPGDEANAAKLHEVLAAWARTPSAPPLMLARQSFPDSLMGGDGNHLVLPASDYDDVVDPAPNIFWANVKMMADQNSIVREFLPYECVQGPHGPFILYSASLLAYGFLQGDLMPSDAPVNHWIKDSKTDCANPNHTPILHGELINYHLSLGKGENGKVWPELPPSWKGFKRCGSATDKAVFRRISAGDVAAAGPDASHELICQRLVVIGGTNAAASDFEQTPLNEMAGPVIMINAVRGLELSGGGLRRVPTWLQLTALLLVSAMITMGFWITRVIRENYLALKSRHQQKSFWVRIRLLPFNPVVLNWAFAFAAHWVGIGLLLLALDRGYWGYLSAPAFASAAVGAMQEFADDDDS